MSSPRGQPVSSPRGQPAVGPPRQRAHRPSRGIHLTSACDSGDPIRESASLSQLLRSSAGRTTVHLASQQPGISPRPGAGRLWGLLTGGGRLSVSKISTDARRHRGHTFPPARACGHSARRPSPRSSSMWTRAAAASALWAVEEAERDGTALTLVARGRTPRGAGRDGAARREPLWPGASP